VAGHSGAPGVEGLEALYRLAAGLERVYLRVPESIVDGEAERLLSAAAVMISVEGGGLVSRPFQGPHYEAMLLARLAQALRARMARAGTPYVDGVDYFAERLLGYIQALRALLGGNPYLPVHDYDATIGIS